MKKGRRLFNTIVSVFLVALLTVGCAGNGTEQSSNAEEYSEQETAGPTKVSIALPSSAAHINTAINVAKAKGFYEEQGLKPEIVNVQGSMEVIKQVGAQNVDFGMGGGDQAIVSRSTGIPITVVAAVNARYPFALVVREDSGIESPEDLKGKTVSVTNLGGSIYLGALAVVISSGLSKDDVMFQSAGDGAPALLAQGKVDGTGTYLGNFDLRLESEGINITRFKTADYAPFMIGDSLIAQRDMIEENPDLVQRFVTATLKGVQYAVENPEEAGEINFEVSPETFNNDLEDAIKRTKIVIESFSSDITAEHGYGFVPEDWPEKTMEILIEGGLLNVEVDAKGTFNMEFQQKAAELLQ